MLFFFSPYTFCHISYIHHNYVRKGSVCYNNNHNKKNQQTLKINSTLYIYIMCVSIIIKNDINS